MSLRIASWNINSVRLRIGNVARLVQECAPDVLCLQETKAHDEVFPLDAVRTLGYPHVFIHGMKSYNGVAVLSRVPFEASETRGWCRREDCRHAVVRLQGGIVLHNVYVPAGGDTPDPKLNRKFAHKLRFLKELTRWFRGLPESGEAAVLLGDLNVAPLETDVWSHKQMLRVVSHTPAEVDLLNRLQRSRQWIDAVRHFVPQDQHLYSWWSYRARDWVASNRGRRLDHIWITPKLLPALRSSHILRDARGWPLPSDHVPVVIDLG